MSIDPAAFIGPEEVLVLAKAWSRGNSDGAIFFNCQNCNGWFAMRRGKFTMTCCDWPTSTCCDCPTSPIFEALRGFQL